MSDPSLPIDLTLLGRTAQIGANGRLELGGCDVATLAQRFGTPLYVYDETELRDRSAEYLQAFGPGGAAYASKAFWCLAMARVVNEAGLDLDVATGGELDVAARAQFPMERVVLHGNNKSEGELARALELGVGRIVVDSFDELDRLDRLAAAHHHTRLMVRVTPGVEAHTHEYIETGGDESKFGLSIERGLALAAVRRVVDHSPLPFAGLHCHIGSQIALLDAFDRAASVVADFVAEVTTQTGAAVPEVSLGGGLGVAYMGGDTFPSVADYAARLNSGWTTACQAAGVDTPRLTVEPGRSIAARAGITLYTVGTIKQIPGVRTYVAVDGGMSDNPRPALYGAQYEAFLAADAAASRDLTVSVAGKHCEQGDVLIGDAHVPPTIGVGDVLVVPVTGAYSASMASNYNRLPRPAVVFVRDGQAREVVRRETFDDLVARETV